MGKETFISYLRACEVVYTGGIRPHFRLFACFFPFLLPSPKIYHNFLHFHLILSVFRYHAPERHSKRLVLTGYAAYGFQKASIGFTELQHENRPVCTYSFSKFWHAAATNSMWAPNSIKSSISRLLNKQKENDIISNDRKPLNKDCEDGVSFHPSFLLYKTLSLLSD